MKSQTLTILDNLKPGDVFCFESGPAEFIKIPGTPVRARRKFFSCHAAPIGTMKPKSFYGKKDVIFLYSNKDILKKAQNWISEQKAAR